MPLYRITSRPPSEANKSRKDRYGANNLVRIKEAFANLAQATDEDRASVTNLTDANMNLVI